MGLQGLVPAGVVTGNNLLKLMEYCRSGGASCSFCVSCGKSCLWFNSRDNGHALPAFNCTSTSTINAVLEVSQGTKAFY